jgi:hypothetical protein
MPVASDRFVHLDRLHAAPWSRRALGRAAAGVALGSVLTWLARAGSDASSRRKRQSQTVTVCHNGRTLTVDRTALQGFLLKGDKQGPCPASTSSKT